MTDEPPPEVPESLSRSERRARAAGDSLRTFVRDLAQYNFSIDTIPDAPVDLTIRVCTDPANNWALTFDPPLRDQVLSQLADVTAEREAYVDGRAYCFRCRSIRCEHALPASPLHVFSGYGQMGTPSWQEFAQVLLDERDDRAASLYGKPPLVVVRTQKGSLLKTDQLSSFGRASKTYSLLGQVIAGYFCPRNGQNPGNGDARFAVSFQFVEIRTARGKVGLRINPVVRLPGETSLSDLFASGWGGWLERALEQGSSTLQQMEARIAECAPGDSTAIRNVMKRIPAVMTQFVNSLERGHRQAKRRTNHSEIRRKQERPVHMAIEDMRKIDRAALLYDEKTNTVIVPGGRNRFHVFAPGGKHVTSFSGNQGTIDFRTKTRRWRPMSSGEQLEFMSHYEDRNVKGNDE
jgi:hypothetical protein